MNSFNDFDFQHINLIRRILTHGHKSQDRTGVGTKKLFGEHIKIDVSDGYLPALRIRNVAPRIAFEELIWMLSGSTDANVLAEKNIKIWEGHSSAEYLESIGKSHIPAGTIGKGYGHQFRNMNGVDQLTNVVDGLKTDPQGRRHVISLWNPCDFPDMALQPCHLLYNFVVTGNRLNLMQYIRSNDVVLGQPYNIMFATFFLGLVAKVVGLRMGEINLSIADAHVYDNHAENCGHMIDAYEMNLDVADAFKTIPMWTVPDVKSLDDILQLSWDDISVTNYSYLLKMTRDDLPMAV